jgi:hypothetical protein
LTGPSWVPTLEAVLRAWPVVLVALLAAACSAGASSSPSASPEADTQPERVFDRLGYAFAPPAGWEAIEGYLDWSGGGGQPHRGAPQFDTFREQGLENDPWLVVGKRADTRSSLDQWIRHLERLEVITYPAVDCVPPERESRAVLGGEPAVLRAFHCPVDGSRAVAVMVLALHQSAGWVVLCYSETEVGDLGDLEEKCRAWLGSFRFID